MELSEADAVVKSPLTLETDASSDLNVKSVADRKQGEDTVVQLAIHTKSFENPVESDVCSDVPQIVTPPVNPETSSITTPSNLSCENELKTNFDIIIVDESENQTKINTDGEKKIIKGDDYVELDTTVNEFDKVDLKIPKSTNTKKSKEANRFVWISNINPNLTANQLKSDISKYGKVLTAKIVTNGEKYYGYVLLEKSEHVKICIEKLNRKKLNGYDIEVSAEAPLKKKSKKVDRSKKRKNDDPLTLKVDSKKKTIRRSRSSSHHRRNREEVARLKKQRELEFEIQREKRQLAMEKQQFEREKQQFLRLQKQLEDAKRIREEKENLIRKREEIRVARDRLKNNSPIRKRIDRNHDRSKSPKKMSSPKRYRSNERKRSMTPPPTVRSKVIYKRDYKEVKRSPSPKRNYCVAPPPPPRLTNDDIRPKIDPWKGKIDYYENGNKKYDYKRYRDEDRYKDKRNYENKETRSEIFVPPSRNNNAYCEQRRFDTNVTYPMSYQNHRYVPVINQDYQMGNVWNPRPLYNNNNNNGNNNNSNNSNNSKDYQTVQKNFHQEHINHPKYEDYDKRYFNNPRKY